MTPELIANLAKRKGFIQKGKTNFVRQVGDVLQLINLQKSNFSEMKYLNFAVWPETFGQPERLAEHIFPLRGRIGAILGKASDVSDDDLEEFFNVIDIQYSSLASIRSTFAAGQMKRLYLSAQMRELLENH